eukprot:CAMPEP_0171327378 /NCGR_PEP_ID=MMETSP0816-20121228/118038_1 /TAXON_ID=420281 /ORGANISM="Proboscia inermis, Strain CCAP1064/1" /LENGTH=442 /DNA_ID=CAMNT_0011827075 /DNA_START=607 /DNA_END=1932 /DNA_ORIENTATION=-
MEDTNPDQDVANTDDYEALLGQCLTADNPGFDTNPTFSPDGTKLAWLSMAGASYEADAVSIKLYDLVTREHTTLLAAEVDWAYSPNSISWSKDGTYLLFTADVKSRNTLCAIDASLGAKGPNGIGIMQSEGATTYHGEIAHNRYLTSKQSLTMPTELFTIEQGKKASPQQMTFFNTDRAAQTALGEPTEFFYQGANDETVQSWLLKPPGFDPTKQYPMAVIYHGGPQGSTGDDWHYRWNLQYYASNGFVVLAPNFHGSTGFGHEFCRAISGNWEVGGIDTIAGVKAALKEFTWIDKDRVVGLGASYGGYTSNWLNGNAPKDMFKALVCHCGTFDLKSSYYSTEELFFMETEFGGPAYTPESRLPSSPYNSYTPSTNLHKWETPTLVIHGAKDYRLVESEGISTFTALQRRGIESEFLYLPAENHHALNPQNSMVWHETVLGW